MENSCFEEKKTPSYFSTEVCENYFWVVVQRNYCTQKPSLLNHLPPSVSCYTSGPQLLLLFTLSTYYNHHVFKHPSLNVAGMTIE